MITIPGAMPRASRNAVVQNAAFIATLTATITATTVAHPTISSQGDTVFNIIAILLWIGCDVLAMQ
jgi:hypothetical protein